MSYKVITSLFLLFVFSFMSKAYSSDSFDLDTAVRNVHTVRISDSISYLSDFDEGRLSKVCGRLHTQASALADNTDRYSNKDDFNTSLANWKKSSRGFIVLLCLGDPVECEGEFKDILQVKYTSACDESDDDERDFGSDKQKNKLYKKQWDILQSLYGEVGQKKEKLSFIKKYLDDYFGD